MNVEKHVLVQLDKDDKEVALKALKELCYAAGELYGGIKEDMLDEEMKRTLFSLVESYTAKAAKLIGYDSNSEKQIEERYREIRQANQQIHELRRKLAENAQIHGLSQLLCSFSRALNDYWKRQGFNLVTDEAFGSWGFKGKFCLSLSRISFMSRKPVTEKEKQENKIQIMMNDGYEVLLDDGEYVLLDTPQNRNKITMLIKSKFSSIDIAKWGNWCLHKNDGFRLTEFEAYIRDLEELNKLLMEMNQSAEEDEG